MPRRTWQVSYRYISKESSVSILRKAQGKSRDSFSTFHSRTRALCLVLLCVTCTLLAESLAAQCSPSQARKLATRTKTITGCLQKGYEPDEFSITGEDGNVWGLRSSAVKLDGYLGHRVTVSGLITHESTAERTLGNKESGDLRVASLKTVSATCDK
jgi:hypothetical protein